MPRIVAKRKSTAISPLFRGPEKPPTSDTLQFVFRKLKDPPQKSTNENIPPQGNTAKEHESPRQLVHTFSTYPSHTAQLVPAKKAKSMILTRRRSSMALRGKKMSTTSSDNITTPHESIPDSEYCRHISPDMPGPLRMKQLVLWGLESIIKAFEGTPNYAVLKQAIQSTMNSLLQNQLSLSWYHRDDNEKNINHNHRTILPNPKNEELTLLVEHYKNFTSKANEEIAAWEKILSHSQKHTPLDEAYVLSTEDAQILQQSEQFYAEKQLQIEKDKDWMESFPFKMNQFHNTCFLLQKHVNYAKGFTDSILRRANIICFSSSNADPLNVLRALSRTNV